MEKQVLIQDGKFDSSKFSEEALAAITAHMGAPDKSPQYAGLSAPQILWVLQAASAVSLLADNSSPEALGAAFEMVALQEGSDKALLDILLKDDCTAYKGLCTVVKAVENRLRLEQGLTHIFGLEGENVSLKVTEIGKKRSAATGHVDKLFEEPGNAEALTFFAEYQLKPVEVVAGIPIDETTVPTTPQATAENEPTEPVQATPPSVPEIVTQAAASEGIVQSAQEKALTVAVLGFAKMVANNQAATGTMLEQIGKTVSDIGTQQREQAATALAQLEQVSALLTAPTQPAIEAAA